VGAGQTCSNEPGSPKCQSGLRCDSVTKTCM
jgi:hypothetical protein